MKILSLFDGMSCGQIAFNSLGIPVERYIAYEIDKYAVETTKHNFPDTEEMGDVFNADFSQYEGFDFVVGGSPCTYWSIAQSPDKRETTASGIGWELFSQYVRAVKECKPKYFIYENNKSMSKAIRESITETFGFEPICINSALVSAQNRQRLYWVGVRNEGGQYDKVNVEQPQDRGILLRDIIKSGYDLTGKEKSYTVTASYDGACAWNTIERSQRTMVAEAVNTTTDGKSQTLKAQYPKSNEQNFCCYSSTYGASGVAEPVGMREVGRRTNEQGHRADDDKSIEAVQRYEVNENPQKTNTLTTVHKDNQVCEPVRVGCLPSPDGTLKNSQAFRGYSVDGKSVNLTSGGGGAGGKTGLYAIPIEFDGDIPIKVVSLADNKPHTVYHVENGQITIKDKQYPIKLVDGYYIIRKLTVKECMRLQTVPEWYEFPVSDTQAYKMLGNGWTVEVIKHLIEATQTGRTAEKQLSFF